MIHQQIAEGLAKATPGLWKDGADMINGDWVARWIMAGESIIIDNLQRYNVETNEYYKSEQVNADFHLIANAPTWLRHQAEIITQQQRYIGFLQSCTRSGESWDGTIDDFIAREVPHVNP